MNCSNPLPAKTVRCCEEDGRMHSADKGLEACQEFVRAAAPVTTSQMNPQVSTNEVASSLVPLCFLFGFRVEANVGQCYAPGTVIAHYDNRRAYGQVYGQPH